MFNKIILLGRSNCNSTIRILKFLKKNSKKVLFFESSFDHKKKVFTKKELANCDYILSYRGLFILKNNVINSPKYGSINFHAGPPEYRGGGAVNFSIFNKEKKFGCTAHLMTEKIDFGPIIDVKRFRINKNDNVETMLNKLYSIMEKQALFVLKKLLRDPSNLNLMIKKNKNEEWSKKINTSKDLDALKKLDLKMKNSVFFRKILVTNYKKFKPFIYIKKRKFILAD